MFKIFSSLFLFVGTAVSAQTFTLQQCIDSALAANILVRQSGLQAQAAQVTFNQSKLNLLPYVDANIYHNMYSGRSIDPSSNGYVDQKFNSADYQISSGIVLFNGNNLRNTVKQNASAYEASKAEWQQSRDNLVLNVMLAYLQVLNNEDLVTSAIQQEEVSGKQLERLDVLNREGAIKPSDYTDVKGQLMNDKLSIVNARNALERSKLTLLQLMNKPYNASFSIERMDVDKYLTLYPASAEEVYQQALNAFAEVRAAELRTKSDEYGAKAARSALFPTISLGGALNTNYSSTSRNASGKIPYDNQLKNNVSSSVGLGISIPIFNRLRQRNQIKLAEIAVKNSELIEENTKLELRQNIEQAYLNMTNAYERYTVLIEQVNAYEASFKSAEVRYNAGVGTSIDYLTAKDRLDRANVNLISARYDYVLRQKVLDYYRNTRFIEK
jgi:outer membrane protein